MGNFLSALDGLLVSNDFTHIVPFFLYWKSLHIKHSVSSSTQSSVSSNEKQGSKPVISVQIEVNISYLMSGPPGVVLPYSRTIAKQIHWKITGVDGHSVQRFRLNTPVMIWAGIGASLCYLYERSNFPTDGSFGIFIRLRPGSSLV